MSDFIKNWSLVCFASAGGEKKLEYLVQHPGEPLFYEQVEGDLSGIIGETGGSIWFCGKCESFGSPNRGCDCLHPAWPKEVRRVHGLPD